MKGQKKHQFCIPAQEFTWQAVVQSQGQGLERVKVFDTQEPDSSPN